VQALNRIIFESAVSLEFLVLSQDGKYFDQFVDFGLGPERELYDQIQANIQARAGEVWPIEERLLGSIGLHVRRIWREDRRSARKTQGLGRERRRAP
jgi:hypothetical protein